MSEPDRLISLPDDTPLSDYYHGMFDAVFVALHPFFTLPGTHPLDCDYGTPISYRSELPDDVDLIPHAEAAEAERSKQKRVDWDEAHRRARLHSRPISWRKMTGALHFADHRLIDRALRTNIGGLRAEFADEAAADILTEFCNKRAIFLPTEGVFQPAMYRAIESLFRQAGAETVIVGDEFGDHECELRLDGIVENLANAVPFGARRIRDPRASLLAIVPWDHFLTVFAMTRESLERVDPARIVEGFWAEPFTTINWFREPLVALANGTSNG